VTLVGLIDLLTSLGTETCEQTAGLSALDHGLQCAAALAGVRPDDTELQLAGLVHDIGHRFGPDDDHARLGAEHVRVVLGGRVAGIVGAHVAAKRYLVATDASYRSRLSPDSVRTLAHQGGPFAPDEVEAFARSRHGADAVTLRRADDAAKVPGRAVPGLDYWVPLLVGQAR